MERESSLQVRLLRILVLSLLMAMCYQLGFASGHYGGDYEQLERQIVDQTSRPAADDTLAPEETECPASVADVEENSAG